MMLPAHKPMDPPTFPKFMFNPYHCCPGWETVRPDMRVDTSTPPSSFGPWVHNGRNSYPGASECNNCCMHNHHPPGYYYYPAPCPHIQPPQHAYAYGAHPAYYGAFPYVVPPHPFEKPRHGYDNSQSHCCGCRDYACQRMENKGVKIEEQKPEVEENGGDSSLVHLPNQHSSAASNHMKEKEQNKNSESQCTYQNGWNPLGINGHKGFRQPGDGHETMHDRIKNSFPWPIFWMPSCNMPEQAMKDLKELNTNAETAEEKSQKLKNIPMKLLEDVNHAGKSGVPEDEGEVQGRSESLSKKESRTKIIPVKQAEESIEKKIHIEDKLNEEEVQKRNCTTINVKGSGDAKKGTTKSIPVKQAEESNEKTLSTLIKHNEENNQKDGSIKMEKEGGGAKKASGNKKLTPICLRVSPLPRKKSSNSSSPSVSPPRQNVIEKIHMDKQVQKPSLKDTNIEVPKKILKVTDSDVRDEVEKQTDKKQQNSEDAWKNADSKETLEQQVNQGNSLLSRGAEISTMSEETGVKRLGDEGNNIEDVVRKTEQCNSSEGMQEGKTLSPVDAAVLIQSVYRGFEVRRWTPIQKLRKIFQIRMKMDDVRNQIQDLEVLVDHQDKKKMMAVNENIMNLLLQLDTIQGMHQFVREARKSAARELIALQEKLDALAKQADSIKVDETSGSSAVLENSIRNVNLELTVPCDDHTSFQPSDDKVSQDQTTMEEFIQNSSEQESNLETLSRSAELEVNNKQSSDKTVVSTLIEKQEEAYLPNKTLNPDGNMLYLSNQEPLPEEMANPSAPSSIQGNSEVCLISENDLLRSSVNIMEEDQVLDSQFELMKQGSLESPQRNEVGASRLGSEEDPQVLLIKSKIPSDAQEFVDLLGEELLDLRNPITEEENNVQETSALSLTAENEDVENIIEVDARANNSDKPHASDANTDHHLSEGVRNTNKKNMDILQTDALINEPGDVIDMENVVDSPVVDRLNRDILGGEGSIKEEAILAQLESPEKDSQLDIMRPKKQEALESIAVPNSESQSTEEVTECSPLLIKVHQQTIETTAVIPPDGNSGQGIEDECVFPEHMILAGGTDARPSEESLQISKHHDECACPRDGIPGTEEIKLVKESKSLILMLENLLEEGRAQIGMIHELNERVKDLEKKLSSQPKKTRTKRYRLMRPCSRKLAS